MQIIAAILLDAVFGDPENIPHPVALIGRVILFFENRLYCGSASGRKMRGAALVLLVLVASGLAVTGLLYAAAKVHPVLAGAVCIYLLYAALAWRSLKDESFSVADALCRGDLHTARRALSFIVGRDTDNLGRQDIIRACVETIAESYIDGVFSVLFYMVLGSWLIGSFWGGALFAWLFKAANTMDSMIGYDDERYKDFGWAAAKFDDILNFIPARLGALVALKAGAFAGMDWKRGLKIFVRDRKKHKSPNSAHGESVFAGLLGISLGGGAFYGGKFESRPFIGEALREPETMDILRSHRILDVSVALCALAVLLWSFLCNV